MKQQQQQKHKTLRGRFIWNLRWLVKILCACVAVVKCTNYMIFPRLWWAARWKKFEEVNDSRLIFHTAKKPFPGNEKKSVFKPTTTPTTNQCEQHNVQMKWFSFRSFHFTCNAITKLYGNNDGIAFQNLYYILLQPNTIYNYCRYNMYIVWYILVTI